MIANVTTCHNRPNDTEIKTIGHRTDFNIEQRTYGN